MKIAFVFVLLFSFVILSLPVGAIENPVTIKVNGIAVEFPDAQPFVDENNRTQGPIGALAKLLDIKTTWNESTQTAQILLMKDNGNGDYIQITIGKNEIEKGRFDGRTGIGFYPENTIEMDTVAVVKNDRTFIPYVMLRKALVIR